MNRSEQLRLPGRENLRDIPDHPHEAGDLRVWGNHWHNGQPCPTCKISKRDVRRHQIFRPVLSAIHNTDDCKHLASELDWGPLQTSLTQSVSQDFSRPTELGFSAQFRQQRVDDPDQPGHESIAQSSVWREELAVCSTSGVPICYLEGSLWADQTAVFHAPRTRRGSELVLLSRAIACSCLAHKRQEPVTIRPAPSLTLRSGMFRWRIEENQLTPVKGIARDS